MFIGTGIYRGHPHEDLLSYLQGTSLIGRKRFALFMTCFGWGKGIADKNVIDTLTAALETRVKECSTTLTVASDMDWGLLNADTQTQRSWV